VKAPYMLCLCSLNRRFQSSIPKRTVVVTEDVTKQDVPLVVSDTQRPLP
jgi:hypothetical protein